MMGKELFNKIVFFKMPQKYRNFQPNFLLCYIKENIFKFILKSKKRALKNIKI